MSAIGRLRAQVEDTGKLVTDWVEDRSGAVTALKEFLYHPVPKRGAWLYTLGSATLFLITLQFLTGILLLFYYVPSTDNAWNSINYIMNEAYFGTLIRGIHYWSANFLLAVIGLHMAQVFISGGYKAPRELSWITGVILLLLVSVMAFTGYTLRWDQDGYWATIVAMKAASYSPFVGSYVIHFLLGGDTMGPATLSRFFAIHVSLLPAILVPLMLVHAVYLVVRNGVFGDNMEYTERLSKLHERQRLEGYRDYEPYDGYEEDDLYGNGHRREDRE
jgi:quinol-cytochrome oxidoreductase complex cytochrome b subunit